MCYESAMEAMYDFKASLPNMKSATVDEAIKMLQAIMTSPRIGRPRLDAQFIVVGRAAEGGMAVGTVDPTGRVDAQRTTSSDIAVFKILHNKEPISLEQQVSARLAKGQTFVEAIEESMETVIRAQAERDPTVNAVIYLARIRCALL